MYQNRSYGKPCSSSVAASALMARVVDRLMRGVAENERAAAGCELKIPDLLVQENSRC